MPVIVVYPWNKIVADITALMSAMTSLLGRVVGVETLNTTQDNRLTAIEAVDVTQNTRLTTLESAFIVLRFQPLRTTNTHVQSYVTNREVIGCTMMVKRNPTHNVTLDQWICEFDAASGDNVVVTINKTAKTVTLSNVPTAAARQYQRYIVTLQLL